MLSPRSSDFVITEHPQGQTIADLLKEQLRFDPEDVLALVIPLAGALDLAASFACCANSISTRWLFAEARRSFAASSDQHSFSKLSPFYVKMDVWEVVRPRKNNIEWPFPTSKAHGGSSRELAVKKAALLTYELLGAEKRKSRAVKRRFKPVNAFRKRW